MNSVKYAFLITFLICLLKLSAQPDPPVASRTIFANTSNLQTVLDAAKAGEHIVLFDGIYSGNFILSRSGTDGNPIVIKSSTPLGAIISGSLTLSGDYTWAYQLYFKSEDGELQVQCNLAGNNASISRCMFNRVRRSADYANVTGYSSIVMGAGTGQRKINLYIGFNDLVYRITKADQFYDACAIFVHTGGEGIPNGWVVERNRFSTAIANDLQWTDTGSNGRPRRTGVRAVYLSTMPRLANIDVPSGWFRFSNNLLDNWEGNSGFYCKEKRVHIIGNTWLNGQGGCKSRQGDEYEVYSNYFENNVQGLTLGLKGFKVYGNIAVNSPLSMEAGGYGEGTGAKGDGPAVDHLWISNRGKLLLGTYNRNIPSTETIRNIRIEDHRAEIHSPIPILEVDNSTIIRPKGKSTTPDEEISFHALPSVPNIKMARKLMPKDVGPDAPVTVIEEDL